MIACFFIIIFWIRILGDRECLLQTFKTSVNGPMLSPKLSIGTPMFWARDKWRLQSRCSGSAQL